jgi:GNAT superfamily N-acetyltransferase
MTIIVKKNTEAKDFIKMIYQTFQFKNYIDTWLNHDNDVICITLYNKEDPVTIALLHRLDFDPLGIYNKPILLDYIYTYDIHRNKGYASKLLQRIKKNNQIQGFCDSVKSITLFKKNGFYVSPKNVFRFPLSDKDYKIDDLYKECVDDYLYHNILNYSENLLNKNLNLYLNENKISNPTSYDLDNFMKSFRNKL